MDPRIKWFQGNQTLLDEKYAQFVINPFGLEESTALGNYSLKTLLHRGMYSTVYTVHETRDILIKYQCNCDQTTGIHRLLTDAWFTTLSNKLGMSPKILFVSPPVPLHPKMTKKFAFTMSKRRWEKCLRERGTVRMMVMERIKGVTMNDFRSKSSPRGIPLNRAVPILGMLIQQIAALHSRKVVHGDIHGGNIILKEESDNTVSLQLIDFGLATFDHPGRSNNATHPIGHWTHELTTPWQIRGLPWGKRDDIYKAFDSFARWINTDEWAEHVKDLVEAGTDELLEFRDNELFFDVSSNPQSSPDSPFAADVLQLPGDVACSIRNRFANMVRRILALDDVNENPPYRFILDELVAIQNILEPDFFVNTNNS